MVILPKHHNQNQQQSHLQPTPYHNQPRSPEIEKVIVCRTVFPRRVIRLKSLRSRWILKSLFWRENAIAVVTRRHSTTSISENAVVLETSYQMLEVLFYYFFTEVSTTSL